MNSTKLVEEVKMLAEQRKAVANKTVIDRALADVQIATAKTALSAAQRKYVEDAEKWAINRDMLKNQKLTSDIDYAYKESMSQADFDTKLSTLAGMEIDQAFNKSKKILMEDTRKDNIRMKAAEQYAEFLKYISAANVVPGDHHFTNLVGLITSVIAGQNLPNDAYVMLTTGDNVVSAPAVKNPVQGQSMKGRMSVFESAKVITADLSTTLLNGIRQNGKDLGAHSDKVLAVNDINGNNTAHNIENINGLQENLASTALDLTATENAIVALNSGKQDAFTGYTGSFSVVTSVDFGGTSITSKTITVSNGVITGVV